MDWLIIAIAAALLFFGPQGQQFARQLGRMYGRLVRLKAEVMAEVATSAGLPTGPSTSAPSLRSALFGIESTGAPSPPPIPTPSPTPTIPGTITHVQSVGMWAVETQMLGAGMGAGTWWMASTSTPGEVVRLR
jgi:hypothetical protein